MLKTYLEKNAVNSDYLVRLAELTKLHGREAALKLLGSHGGLKAASNKAAQAAKIKEDQSIKKALEGFYAPKTKSLAPVNPQGSLF